MRYAVSSSQNIIRMNQAIRKRVAMARSKDELDSLYQHSLNYVRLATRLDAHALFSGKPPKKTSMDEFEVTARAINDRAKQLGIQFVYKEKYW